VESEPVELFTLESGELRARITSFGATLVALEIPGGRGERADVVLGFDGLAGYESAHNPYFGGLVGRCANRIAGARFTLDGRKHRLSANEGRNHLHGGRRGFDRRPWRALSVRDDGLVLHLRSPAGEEGYPGRVDVQASFTLSTDALALHLEGTSDAPTPLALTQHVYFNLAGSGTILDHVLEVFSERIVVVDDALLPTGELAGVAGTVFDFRSPARIGERIEALRATPAGGYDVCYALDKPPGTLGLAARLREPGSGRVLELLTSEPGLQLYTGNRLDGLAGKGGRPIERFGGVCLEAQHFPDAVNHAGFPSVVLRPRERYRHDTVWRLPGRDR
jgi:aldose 1-epimerase